MVCLKGDARDTTLPPHPQPYTALPILPLPPTSRSPHVHLIVLALHASCQTRIRSSTSAFSTLHSLVLPAGPVTPAVAVAGGQAVLPCNISSLRGDSFQLVLWYRDHVPTPVFR
ncbi:hypothetical protein E2C01_048979 [Portunus trituberculatus]|uniref:Ig-like domain-containing protein n=1 Tax=Portunus trituberculatus TaxID=210409 RepID=A0A5B7GCZ6_PORTR|nr:hypothetical protein [Portunus trituberculatus]